MLLHLLYILMFTVIAFLAVRNLIRNLMTLGVESQRGYTAAKKPSSQGSRVKVPHPELLDDNGQPTSEPLLVVKSLSVEDARERLDALYDSSPSATQEQDEEPESR